MPSRIATYAEPQRTARATSHSTSVRPTRTGAAVGAPVPATPEPANLTTLLGANRRTLIWERGGDVHEGIGGRPAKLGPESTGSAEGAEMTDEAGTRPPGDAVRLIRLWSS